MIDQKYPIGKYIEQPFSEVILAERLLDIEQLPKALEYAITNLDAHQLDVPYREGGWNSKQVVHHVADSHMNALIRFKLCLTENNPTIKPYDENAWALLNDVNTIPINVSITLLYALHARMIAVLKSVRPAEWERTVFHPESKKEMSLWYLLGLYAWHGKHHTAHINSLSDKQGW